ncbi:MAG: DMT family transporter, partial [Deltaproteobacteria bacterium]|nr:DMT family transporter [Deltaproteobacteria bacterium]
GAPPINKDTFKKLFLLALFQPGLYFFFETYGLKFTSATKTSLIIATIPVLVLILSTIFLKERVRLINAAGILMSLLGVALLVFGEREAAISSGVLWGDFLIFGAVVSATIYIIFARYLGQTISAVQITGLQVIFGALLFLPFFLWDLGSMNWQQISMEAIIAVICLTVFATIGAFLCYNFALSRIGAARASVFINAIPVITAFGAWTLLGETLTPIQIMGGIVVIFAVYLANFRLQL